jgi:G3E family GTPase
LDRVRRALERSLGEEVILVLPPHEEPALVRARQRGAGARFAAPGPTICVLDAARYGRDVASWEMLHQRGLAAGPGDGRYVADLWFEHVEAASLIVIAEHDAPEDTRIALRCLLSGVAPAARVCSEAELDGLLQEISAGALPPPARPVWSRALASHGESTLGGAPARAFAFRARAPFHPTRFARWLDGDRAGAVRAKGRLWLAHRPEDALGFSQSGAVARLFQLGTWWAATPRSRWPLQPGQREQILAHWDPRFGDREQALAFVGPALDAARLRAELSRCLLNPDEQARGVAAWARLPDPLALAHARPGRPWSLTAFT